MHLLHGLADGVLHSRVCCRGVRGTREHICQQLEEALVVPKCQLGQRCHLDRLQHQVGFFLWAGRLRVDSTALLEEAPSDSQDGLEGSQAPIIVLLGGEQLLGEAEQRDCLAADVSGGADALAKQQDLSDEFIVGDAHGHAAEQLLEVVRQLGAPAVALAGRVERHKDAGVEVHVDGLPHEVDGGGAVLEGALDLLDLLAHSAQHLLLQAVKLVKATPSAAFHQAHKDAAHGLEVELLVAVEDKHLPGHRLPQSLHTLRLAGAGGAIGVATVPQGHALR
mmetsp:Transcript_9476/g.27065  ORF Transcript_9476/g.27065 Transcript_9476/m.27065 type:complete len:279 (+) Transcript_9476:6945-7781(+)